MCVKSYSAKEREIRIHNLFLKNDMKYNFKTHCLNYKEQNNQVLKNIENFRFNIHDTRVLNFLFKDIYRNKKTSLSILYKYFSTTSCKKYLNITLAVFWTMMKGHIFLRSDKHEATQLIELHLICLISETMNPFQFSF